MKWPARKHGGDNPKVHFCTPGANPKYLKLITNCARTQYGTASIYHYSACGWVWSTNDFQRRFWVESIVRLVKSTNATTILSHTFGFQYSAIKSTIQTAWEWSHMCEFQGDVLKWISKLQPSQCSERPCYWCVSEVLLLWVIHIDCSLCDSSPLCSRPPHIQTQF